MAGSSDVRQNNDHEVDYLRRTPLKRRGLRRRPKDRPYIDTGAPSFGGEGDDHVVYVRRTRVHRPWYRRPLIVIPLIVLLIAIAGGVFVLTQRNVTTEVKLADVVERFEAQEAKPVIEDDPAVPANERIAETAAAEAVADDDAPRDGAGEIVRDVDPYTLPEEGVYLYRTTGGERISVFGARHDYPERMYSTVVHSGGCRWQQRNDVIEEHVDIRKVCSRPDELLQLSQQRIVTFFGKESGDEQVCEPWASLHALTDEKGAKETAVCHGQKGGAELTRTFLGMDTVLIEGQIEQAVRVRIDATFTGETTGGSMDDYWLSRRTGLPLRWNRTVDAVSRELGPEVRYNEEATFELVSLDPQR